jgi:ferredoxin
MKFLLRFLPHIFQEPLTAEVILGTGAKINIARANIDASGGEMLIDVPDEKCDIVVRAFESRGIEIVRLEQPISLNKELCTSCGACISTCPVQVFTFGEDWRVALNAMRCIRCGICITACPFNALSI